MPAILIVLGSDPQNRLQLPAATPGTASVCSPICDASTGFVSVQDAGGTWKGRFSRLPGDKPAEAYVMGFADLDAARAWAAQHLSTDQVRARRVVLLDLPDAAPFQAPAGGATVVVIGDDPTQRLMWSDAQLAAATGIVVFGPCTICDDSKPLSADPAGLASAQGAAPAETYVLGFDNLANAAAFVSQAVAPLAAGQRTTVLIENR